MVRPNWFYKRFPGRTIWYAGREWIDLGDLFDWLLSRFNVHIRHARQTEADELDDVIDGLPQARLDEDE